ncbi:MAG: NERD domain-containing protein, partial [Lachnospiraceae bacterium]|nr:NERD domain-containing protein [Lachnospiraceae bacterium]
DYKNLLIDSGKYGKYLIYKNLKQYEQLGAKFLFNCYLNKEDDSTTEIDVMLICQGGIFVFESKNYSGWIFGNGKSKNWTQTLPVGKGQSKKISFYNPVKQNNTHIKYLKKLIGDDIPVYSVIVFSDKCSLMNVNVSTKSARVIQCKEVKSMVDSLGGQTKHKLDIRQIYELYSRLYPFTQVNSEIKERHIGDVEKIIGRQKKENNNSQSVSLLCPRCGAPLEIKMSMRGKTIGEKFYSCSTFPVCKYSRSIEINEKEWKKE